MVNFIARKVLIQSSFHVRAGWGADADEEPDEGHARRADRERVPRADRLPVFSIEEQLLRRIVTRFRRGLVFKAHRLLYHSTLGSSVRKKRKKKGAANRSPAGGGGYEDLGQLGQDEPASG